MDPEQTIEPAPKRNLLRKFCVSAAGILFFLALGLAALSFIALDRAIAAPDWVRDKSVERMNAASPDFDVKFGGLELQISPTGAPRARVRNVEIVNSDGAEIISFSEAEVQLATSALLVGEIKPKRISISGVVATLLRDEDGNVSLRGGSALTNPSKNAANLPALIEQLDGAFELPELRALEAADIQALTLRYEDARIKRVWVVDGGRLRLNHDGDELALAADIALLSGGTNVATLEANYTSQIGDRRAEFGINISDIAAQDIAQQSPVLALSLIHI